MYTWFSSPSRDPHYTQDEVIQSSPYPQDEVIQRPQLHLWRYDSETPPTLKMKWPPLHSKVIQTQTTLNMK